MLVDLINIAVVLMKNIFFGLEKYRQQEKEITQTRFDINETSLVLQGTQLSVRQGKLKTEPFGIKINRNLSGHERIWKSF